MTDTITATQAADILGLGDGPSARRTLRRYGVDPVGRAPGRGGESLYDPDAVRQVQDNRARRGRPSVMDGAGATVTLSFGAGVEATVNLAILTPAARALAEVMAAQPLPEMARCEVALESRLPLRELVPPERHVMVSGDLDQRDTDVTRGFSPWRPEDQDVHGWLEYEAAKRVGWVAVRPWLRPDWRAPSADAALDDPDELLSRDAALAYLRRRGVRISIEGFFAGQREGTIPTPTLYTTADQPRWSMLALAGITTARE